MDDPTEHWLAQKPLPIPQSIPPETLTWLTEVLEDRFGEVPERVWQILFPRWLYERYESMEEEMATDAQRAMFWKMYGDTIAEVQNDIELLTEANAEATSAAALQLEHLQGAMERAFAIQLWRMRKDGVFRFLKGEYSTLYAWMGDKLANAKPSEASNLRFFIEEFLPTLERLGYPAEGLMVIPDRYGAARAAVPKLRDETEKYRAQVQPFEEAVEDQKELIQELRDEWLETGDEATRLKLDEAQKNFQALESRRDQETEKATEELTQTLTDILDVVATTPAEDVPKRLRNELQQTPAPARIPGRIYNLARGRSLIVIPVGNSFYSNMAQRLLEPMIEDWNIGDAFMLMKELSETVLLKTGKQTLQEIKEQMDQEAEYENGASY